jgi:uncharacterized lipoprotein YbaY/heat shock protein HslJ
MPAAGVDICNLADSFDAPWRARNACSSPCRKNQSGNNMIARIALSLALVASLADTAAAQALMGQVSYPESRLSRTAVLEVTLEDVSDANAAVVVGSTRIPQPGQGPTLFTVVYAPDRVVPAGRYAVRARIVDGATTLFESARPVRVLTQGTGSVASITLVQPAPLPVAETSPRDTRSADVVAAPAAKREPSPKPTPTPTPTPTPKPTSAPRPAPEAKPAPEPKPTPAPKATPTPKASPTPKATPTPTPKPAAAPKATPTPTPKPAAAPKVTPAAEPAAAPKEAAAPKPTAVSTQEPAAAPVPSNDAAPRKVSAPPSDATPLAFAGAEWTMTEIDNKPVRATSKTHRKISLIFDEGHGTFSGTSGCNDLAGRFETGSGRLTLKSDRSLRICRVDQKTERAVRGVINDTRAYRLSGTTLDLLNDRGQRIARFEGQQR